MTERADASGYIPSPGEGKGLGLGVRPLLMKERWEWLESPSRRLGIIDIRGFILCVAQFVTRKNQNLFWFFARLIVLCCCAAKILTLGKENKNSVICFAFLSLIRIFVPYSQKEGLGVSLTFDF